MNKRGILIFEIGIWLMRITMVIVIIMGVALQIRTYINAKVNLDVAEPALLVQVLGNSPALLYRDAGGSMQRAIAVEQFVKAGPALNDVLAYSQRHAAAKLTLMEQDRKEIKAVYVNEDYYKELSAQTKAWLRKTAVQQERQWPVMLIEQGKERPGVLRVEVLQPR